MNRPFVALLAALFAGGVAASPIRTLLPAYVEGVLRQPPFLTSVLLAIQLGTGGAFALLAGSVAARFGQRATVLCGLMTPLVGASLFVMGAPPLLVLAALLWGVAGGFQSAGGQSFMIAAVRKERLGTASAAYFVSSTAASAVGAYAAGVAADRLGYRVVAAGAAALGATALALAWRFLPAFAESAPATATTKRSGAYSDLLQRPEILALCAVRYFPTVAWGAASLTIPLLLFRLGGGAAATVGAYGTVSLLCATGAQLATGRLVDLRGSVRPLLAPLTGAIIVSAALAALAVQAGAFYPLFAAGTLWTMSAWGLSTTMPPLIRELSAPLPDGRDRLVGLAHLMWSAGMLTGTLAAGLLIELSPVGPLLLALGCLLVTFAVAVWVTTVRRELAGA
ncbi:MAG TPA: MFS transporter [Chloroflexota bacterium]|nr:MFS transporter [Chloroflexota bacterium]